MKRSAKIGLAAILAFWLVVIVFLILAANRPAVVNGGDRRLEHPDDGYVYLLKSGWGTKQCEEKRLLLTNEKYDAAVLFLLETGGYAYKSDAAVAKMLIEALSREYGGEVSFDADSPAIADSVYEGIRFSGSINGDEALFFVFRPDVGLRLYAICVYDEAVPEKIKKEAEAMAVSAEFDDVEAVYAKYLSEKDDTEDAEEAKE